MEVPPEGEHIWEWFWDISNHRESHERPLGHRDIADWLFVTRNYVSKPECDILFAMDFVFRKALSEEIKANNAREEALRKARKRG